MKTDPRMVTNKYLLQSASIATLKLQNHKKQHAETPSKQAFYGTVDHHHVFREENQGVRHSLPNQQQPGHPCDSVKTIGRILEIN